MGLSAAEKPSQTARLQSAVAGLVLAAAVATNGAACDTSKDTRFVTARADRGPIVAKVTASGTLSALVTVQVGSQVSGRIKELLVDFNAPVTKGQVIARIDPQLFDAALAQARANSVAARADLSRAKVQAVDADRQLARAQGLFDRKLIAQADLDAAQTNADAMRAAVESADGRVAQAQAALNQAGVNLAYTTIVSPISGMVISRNVDVGQTVAASLQAPTLFVIAEDLKRMQVDTTVAEADIGRLRDGMTALFTVDAYPGERFQGSVRQIRNAATTVQNVVTYDAVIDVDNPEMKLKPGMTANVTFVYAQKDAALRVPNSALRFRATPEMLARSSVGAGPSRPDAPSEMMKGVDGREKGASAGAQAANKRTVWRQRDAETLPVMITVGITDGVLTEVVDGGLEDGDAVVIDAVGGSGAGPSRGGPFRPH
jgi:HlyD family secretion protein